MNDPTLRCCFCTIPFSKGEKITWMVYLHSSTQMSDTYAYCCHEECQQYVGKKHSSLVVAYSFKGM